MLVLTRKIDESVVVGDAAGGAEMVKVTVVSIIGGRVRLGFEVPADLPIHRWEVWQRIRGAGPVDKPIEAVAVPAVRN